VKKILAIPAATVICHLVEPNNNPIAQAPRYRHDTAVKRHETNTG